MSNLPVNFVDGAAAHTAAHNNTNAQVNINSRPATAQTITHTVAGVLTIDAEDGYTAIVDVQANITSLTVNNLIVGMPFLLLLRGDPIFPYVADMSNVEIDSSTTCNAALHVPAGGYLGITFTETVNGDLWAPAGVLDFDVEPPVLEARPIDASRVTYSMTPGNVNSWGRNRAKYQWIIAGDRVQVGRSSGDLHGLTWNGAGDEIVSFLMQDATTERLTTGLEGSIPTLETTVQYVEDGSYNPANNLPDGTNSGINSPPSDELYFDGTRVQLAMFEDLVRVGPGGTPIRFAVSFMVQSWMAADDWTSVVQSVHTPTTTHSGPMNMRIRNNTFYVFTRDSISPIDVNTQPNPSSGQTLVEYTLPAVGQWVTLIMDYLVDPGGDGYFNAWTLDATANLVRIGQAGNDFGYIFTDSSLNAAFYSIILKTYNWHQFTVPGVVNNWDGNNVRRQKFAYFIIDYGTDVGIDEYASHARYHLGL